MEMRVSLWQARIKSSAPGSSGAMSTNLIRPPLRFCRRRNISISAPCRYSAVLGAHLLGTG